MGGIRSEQSPIPEPLATAAQPSAAAAPAGPAPGRLDLDRGREAAPPTAPGPNPAGPTSGLTEVAEPGADPTTDPDAGRELPRRPRPRRGRRRLAPPSSRSAPLTPQQRLLLLDTWQRSGLPAGDFAALVGVSKHTLSAGKKPFDTLGPAGLIHQPRGGPAGSKLPDLTKRTILMLKQANPDFGCPQIRDLRRRGPALPARPAAVARVLPEAGSEFEDVSTRPHPDHVRSFERAQPKQLWPTDRFPFVRKRPNRRVYLVAFLDDHRRFGVSYGLPARPSTALVLEVLRAGLANYGPPAEILTDTGSPYVTGRGPSAFAKERTTRGIRQVVAPRRPQTLGKIERFGGTRWREGVEAAVCLDLGDAPRRIGLLIAYYHFQRPHQGVGGLGPADRFLGAAPEMRRTLTGRGAAQARERARPGVPKAPFDLTGPVAGQPFRVPAEGARVILTAAEGRREVDRVPPAPTVPVPLPEPVCPIGVVASARAEASAGAVPAPGTSPLDAAGPPVPPAEGGDPCVPQRRGRSRPGPSRRQAPRPRRHGTGPRGDGPRAPAATPGRSPRRS